MVDHPWQHYSAKLKKHILDPRAWGTLGARAGMRTVQGEEGVVELGNALRITLLVDLEEGIIADAKFTAFGETALIGAADIVCELVIGKTYVQAMRLSADMIDQKGSFPPLTYPHINFALSALEEACSQCTDIPVSTSTPLPQEFFEGGNYPEWTSLTQGERLSLLEEIIQRDIRPFIELDDGGVRIEGLEGDLLTIAYEGACTTCPASFGATLHAIQQLLRTKLHPTIVVAPKI